MLEYLKKEVLKACLDLVKYKLVLYTWGNVSAIDREKNLVVIKPSGVNYEDLTAEFMTVVDLHGNIIEGKYKPSSDTPTHLEIYKAFREIASVTHTHSTYATAFAQSGNAIQFLGTTHADYFYGDIPCTRELTKKEVENDYEKNTGFVIADTFKNINPLEIPAVLVKSHGVFTFGKNAENSVHNAVVLENIAKMAYLTKNINPKAEKASDYILDKHFLRKNGKNSYYGQ